MTVTYNDINNIGGKLREGKYNLQLKYAPKTAYKISYNISQLSLAYFTVNKDVREKFSAVEESEDKYDEFQTYLNEHTLEVTFKTLNLRFILTHRFPFHTKIALYSFEAEQNL